MKKIFIFILALATTVLSAQNIQFHYDMGKLEDGTKRDFFVGTLEHLQFDSLGYTYVFADFEFGNPTSPKGASLGYFEIARTFNIYKGFIAHIEYNDGLVIYPVDSITAGENLKNSWLGGLEYGWVWGNLSLNTMVLYKYIYGSTNPDFQFTTIWACSLFKNRISLLGYVDLWTQDDFYNDPSNKTIVLYSEPQVWVNFNEHFALGSEFKVSHNFFPTKRVEVFPTIGVKYQF